MKHTLTSRILIAGFALALMITASVGVAKVDVPTKVMLRSSVNDVYGRPINDGILIATINPNGSFTFTNVPAGKYELLLSGSQEYFAAKAAETNNLITIDFDWASTSSMNKTLVNTSHSNIRFPGTAAPGGSGGDSSIKNGRGHVTGNGRDGSAITTGSNEDLGTKNVRGHTCGDSGHGVTSVNINGKTIYCETLLKNITITGDSSPSGKISNLAIKGNGGK